MSILRWGAIVFLVSGSVAGCGTPLPSEPVASTGAPLSQSEHAALEIASMAKCLDEQGWKVTVNAKGGIDAGFPTEQLEAYTAASETCREQFLSVNPRPALDKADLALLYKHQMFLVECLNQKGYPPVMEIPSQEEFVSAGLTGKAHDFFAWSAVSNIGSDVAAELERDCPQSPPGL